jgi:hypothetical protein
MPSPTWLRDMKMTKVDSVDRPADEHAVFSFFKNDKEANSLTPSGTFAGGSTDLAAEVAKLAVSKQNQDTGRGTSTGNTNPKEGSMPTPLTEEIMKGLPDEVLEYIETLEKASDMPDDEEDDEDEDPKAKGKNPFAKGLELPTEVMEMLAKRDDEITELRKSAEDSATIAKAERDLRVTREWQGHVDELSSLSFDDKASVVKSMKELHDTNPALATSTLAALKAANGQAESSSIFTELGKGMPSEGSAEGKMEKLAKSIQIDEKVTEAQSWDLAMQRQPDLYTDYLNEGSR